jgi:integrase
LLLTDIRRLLNYLKAMQQVYGSALAFNLAKALFQTACRFDELITLKLEDCHRVEEEILALCITGKGSVFHDVPVPERLSAALLEWKGIQESFKARRIMAPGRIAFVGSEFVFAGYSGAILKPSVQFTAARGVQGNWGGAGHSSWAAAFCGHDPA